MFKIYPIKVVPALVSVWSNLYKMVCVTECKLQQSSSDIYKNLGLGVRHSYAIHFTGLKRWGTSKSLPICVQENSRWGSHTCDQVPHAAETIAWILEAFIAPILSSSSTAEQRWTRAMLPPAATSANVIVQQAEGDTNRDSGGRSRIWKTAMLVESAAALIAGL